MICQAQLFWGHFAESISWKWPCPSKPNLMFYPEAHRGVTDIIESEIDEVEMKSQFPPFVLRQ